MRDTYYGDYYEDDAGSSGYDEFGNPLYGIPYTSMNAPGVPAQGFQYPTGPVPDWQIATGNGSAPAGAFLPNWRPGQPDQQGATDQFGVPYEPVQESQPEVAPPPEQYAPPPQEQYAPPPPPVAGPPSGGGGGGGAPGGGLFNPNLYTPFEGTAPTYHPPTLPTVPSFDNYYDQSQFPAPVYQPPVFETPVFQPPASQPEAFKPPVYKAPAMRQAPAFEPGRFKAPTLDDAMNQPGYMFGVNEGERALQQSRAAQGVLRTGGTLKDILNYGRNAATQNYGNVFNQDLESFKTNEGGRVNAYNTNYQTQVQDPNQYDLLNAQSEFNNQLSGNKFGLDVANSAFSNKLAGNQFGLDAANSAFSNQLAGNQFGLDVAQTRYAPQLLQYQTDAANAQRQAEIGYNADWQKYLDEENVYYQNQSGPFSKYLSLAQLGAANA